jgi:hypothetical protein
MTGVIMKTERSFAFLVDEAHTKRWFHRRDMVGPLRPTVGLVVEFEAATDAKGRPQAVQVRPIPQPPFAARGAQGGAPLVTLGELIAPAATTQTDTTHGKEPHL